MSSFTGNDLQRLMLLNSKSLTRSAEILGITVDELKSYFLMESFEDDFILNIRDKLNLLQVIDIPGAITIDGLDWVELHKNIIKSKDRELHLLTESLLTTYEVIKASLPEIYKKSFESNHKLLNDYAKKMNK